MAGPPTRLDDVWGRPRKRHLLAASGAVAVSALLHYALLVAFPSLPIGRLARVEGRVPLPPIRLRDVRRQFSEPVLRPARFRPEDPGRPFEVAPDAEAMLRTLEAALPDAPDLSGLDLAAESAPLAGPGPAEEPAGWEPRQDILQVENALFSEDVSALPRRYVDSVPRAGEAPDITLPEDNVPASVLRRLAGRAGEGAAETAGQGLRDRAAGGAGRRLAMLTGAQPLAEETTLLDEAPAEVTDLQPVEQLLDLDLRVYRPEDEEDTVYFEIRVTRKGAGRLPVLPRDVLLVQDCSESMTQAKLNECKQGLRLWLDRLAPGDRFELIGFRETPEACFGGWTNLTPLTRGRAELFIEGMTARGKTDVYGSMTNVLTMPAVEGRPVLSLLVTDGRPTAGLVDSSDIIDTFTKDNGGSRSVFCVGGGRRVNRFLLDMLGYRNRGDSLVVEDRREIPGAMAELADEVVRPVLVDLTWRFTGIPEEDVYPRTLTHLYLDRPLVVCGTCRAGTDRAAVQIIGRSGPARHDMVFDLDLSGAGEGGADIRTRWAWHRIYHLIGRHIETGRAEVMDEIHVMAGRYGLVVPYGGDIPLP